MDRFSRQPPRTAKGFRYTRRRFCSRACSSVNEQVGGAAGPLFRSDPKSLDPAVTCFDELDAAPPVFPVAVEVLRNRWRFEVVERREESDRGVVVGNHVLQQPEVDVAAEVLKGGEEM